MPTRMECERHVYRLALLLTGSPQRATRVIRAVVKAQPDLTRLDRAHLERLTILRSREQPRGQAEIPGLDGSLTRFLDGLDRQPREAWLLIHALVLEPRPAAKAMDCSITALDLHLSRAHEAMAGAKLTPDAPEALTAVMRETELPEFYVEQRRRETRLRRVFIILAIVFGILGSVALTRWLIESLTT